MKNVRNLVSMLRSGSIIQFCNKQPQSEGRKKQRAREKRNIWWEMSRKVCNSRSRSHQNQCKGKQKRETHRKAQKKRNSFGGGHSLIRRLIRAFFAFLLCTEQQKRTINLFSAQTSIFFLLAIHRRSVGVHSLRIHSISVDLINHNDDDGKNAKQIDLRKNQHTKRIKCMTPTTTREQSLLKIVQIRNENEANNAKSETPLVGRMAGTI